MAFTQSTFAPVGAHSAPTPNVYSYSSSDALVSVVGTGYFEPKQFQLEVGDWILAYLSDGHALLEVQADTTTAKVVNLAVSTEPVIVYVSSASYTINGGEDVLVIKATTTVVFPEIVEGLKRVAIVVVSGGVGFATAIGDTIDTASMSIGQSKTFFADTEDNIWRSGL